MSFTWLLSLIFTFSPKGVNMSKYNSFFFLATWIAQMVAMLPYLVTERPDFNCHPLGIRVGRSVVPELHAAIVPMQEEVCPVLLLSCLREEVKSGDAFAHAQWNPVSFAGDGEEGGGCGVLSCASQGSSRSSNECIQGSNHHDWFMR